MSVAFLPFPTLLLNRYFGSVSVIFYAGSMAAAGILLGSLWIHSCRRRLLRDVDARLDSYHTLRALYAPAIFLMGGRVLPSRRGVAAIVSLVVASFFRRFALTTRTRRMRRHPRDEATTRSPCRP